MIVLIDFTGLTVSLSIQSIGSQLAHELKI
jgi:hypothetical protein